MTIRSLSVVVLSLLGWAVPSVASAQTVHYSAYMVFGSGLLLVLALTIYVIRQIRFSLRNYHSKRP
ncbi:hypothetical protein MUB05_12420 [Acinetobacter indicus]|uniref:hypothetical protein n=1 Tax=Acinetobacter TaxID=469 RepID=UPI001363F65E|nr:MULTISPECIES: hypothetical protein [Acinetobacter]MCP0917376.1 hypothetical protein [Acinetobacter indicus]MCP0920489.1 hypothetical protein [Acinetobacter indicus]MCP0923156.1 hypothetical protein [Acinetobacter indicus]